jgi:hypothetical protein
MPGDRISKFFQAKQISAAVASPLAAHTGLLRGTNVVNRPFLSNETIRKIGLSWRRCTRCRNGPCSERAIDVAVLR